MTGPSQLRPAAGWLARRLTERAADAADALTGRLGGPRRHPELPPRRLRARVGAPGAQAYLASGARAVSELERALGPDGFAGFATVLDFGCGPGRVLTHLAQRDLDRPRRLLGVDVDAEAIAWAQAHLPGTGFTRSNALPPLDLADGACALVYSISVFSHLDESAQDAWLAELARILAPGGTALLSTHGPDAFAAFRSRTVRTAWCDPRAFTAHGPLAADAMVAVPYRQSRWSRGDLPGVGAGYGLAFHGPDYIRARWGAFLEVEAILPQAISGWQDLVVARGPGGTGATSGPLGTESK